MQTGAESAASELLEKGLETYLNFCERLTHRHQNAIREQNEIKEQISKIREKEKDNNLYLGVIGEFSSGKSTLVNALLRDDLLRTDVIQATTASATVITYGNELDVIVNYIDGKVKSFRKNGLAFWQRFLNFFKQPDIQKQKKSLMSFLHDVTSQEDFAKEVEKVTLYYPTTVLQNGLVIVDTPGLNVDNERHIDVTSWAIRELCDVGIVVIPANVPLSQSLIQFLENYLSDVLHRCVFLISKIDLIKRPKERDQLINYVQRRLESEFNLKDPTVLPISPIMMIDNELDLADNQTQELNTLVDQFIEVEQQLYQTLNRQKGLIQIEKTSALLGSVFSQLTGYLKTMEQTYLAKHEELEKNKVTDLEGFIQDQKLHYSDNIERGADTIYKIAIKMIADIKEKVIRDVNLAITEAENEDDLRFAVSVTVSDLMDTAQKDIDDKIRLVYDKIREIGNRQLSKFEDDFKALYKSLATLDEQYCATTENFDISKDTNLSGEYEENTKVLDDLLEEDETKEKWKTYGGAGVGAALGTVVLPVIGTAIGGAVGWLAGKLFGPSVAELKRKYRSQVHSAIKKSFQEVEISVLKSITGATNKIKTNLDSIIDEYFNKYNQLVQEMISRDEAEAEELSKNRLLIQKDLESLESYKENLKKARENYAKFHDYIHLGSDVLWIYYTF